MLAFNTGVRLIWTNLPQQGWTTLPEQGRRPDLIRLGDVGI
jgi:hypothetical protein